MGIKRGSKGAAQRPKAHEASSRAGRPVVSWGQAGGRMEENEGAAPDVARLALGAAARQRATGSSSAKRRGRCAGRAHGKCGDACAAAPLPKDKGRRRCALHGASRWHCGAAERAKWQQCAGRGVSCTQPERPAALRKSGHMAQTALAGHPKWRPAAAGARQANEQRGGPAARDWGRARRSSAGTDGGLGGGTSRAPRLENRRHATGVSPVRAGAPALEAG